MDGGRRILKHHVLLLKVFVCIGGRRTTDYSRALVTQLALWIQLKQMDHPAWHMFLENASCFNEECGELSFSALARQVARGGSRSSFPQSNKQFKLLKTGMQVAADFRLELNGPKVSQRNGTRIKDEGKDVQATVAFFKRAIHQILNNSYRHYDEHLGRPQKKNGNTRPTVLLKDVVESTFKDCAPFLE
jgi:hypothetical protein